MTETLTFPRSDEAVEFDHDVLSALCRRHGVAAEAHIAARLSEIEQLLGLARLQLSERHVSGLTRTADDLAALGREIGMRTLERIAGSVLDCLRTGNEAALVACTQRMLRLGRPDTLDHWIVRRGTVA
ncbi:MAG: hypothetical protein WBA25_16575 [Jannaschia sp.]